MGFVNSLYSTNETVEAVFKKKTTTNTNGVIDYSYSTILTKDVLFWEGKAVDSVVSEKIRAVTDGVIVVDFEDYTISVSDIDKVTINSTDYSVIQVDNVANQNQVIQIPVKKVN